jgi:7-cyano-7-deazaguanine synthase
MLIPKSAVSATAVLFSAGLDSAVLAAREAVDGPVHPIYVSTGLAWEAQEIAAVERLLQSPVYGRLAPLARLAFPVGDVYPATHWGLRGTPPAYDTPDEDVYLIGRNIILLSKAGIYCAQHRIGRIALGPLAGNPFPDATPAFFEAMSRALTLGLAGRIDVVTPLASLHKRDVVRLGAQLHVPFELTLSCMNPRDGRHCGRCSKCRERQVGFREAGITDPTEYVR